MEAPDAAASSSSQPAQASSSALGGGPSAGASGASSSDATRSNFKAFGGSGNTLGSGSRAGPVSSNPSTPAQQSSNTSAGFSEEAIQSLIGLGLPRPEALRLLEAAGGDPVSSARILNVCDLAYDISALSSKDVAARWAWILILNRAGFWLTEFHLHTRSLMFSG